MPAVLVTGLLLHRTRRFFPSGGWIHSHCQYSLLPTHGRMAQSESTWVPGSVPRWFTRVQRRSPIEALTGPGVESILIESNALPLRHASTLIFANENVYGKSTRIVHAPTYDEYFGRKILAIGSTVYEEIGLARGTQLPIPDFIAFTYSN